MESRPLRYLSSADVRAAMPPLEVRLELATRTMLALVGDADLPPKIGVHPAPAASFGHAMPAWMRGADPGGADDLLGVKWVVGFPGNAGSDLPAIHATIILSDASTGQPRAIVDATEITAQRTAAVSGVAIARWGPSLPGPTHVTLVGTGVQARSHLQVISHLLPGAELTICGGNRGRLEALAEEASAPRNGTGSFSRIETTTDRTAAVSAADLVVTLVGFGPERQTIPESAFGPHVTVVAVDYDMCVSADFAASADLFLTDDREQFLANRTDVAFRGYRDPDAMIGEAIERQALRPRGRVLVSHLGVGLADVVFADAILRAAVAEDLGTILPR